MKVLTMILLVVALFQKDGKKTYWESGEIKTISKHNDACDCDSVKEFFKEGWLWMKYQTRDREYVGPYLRYYANGKLAGSELYKNGKINGFAFTNNVNGGPASNGFYQNDIKTGLWKYFNSEDSTIYKEIIYQTLTRTYPDGEDDGSKTTQTGNASVSYFYQGKPAFTGEYKNWLKVEEKVLNTDLKAKYVSALPDGKSLYDMHCTACHMLNKDLIGPALAGVGNRYSKDWLIKMIRNDDILLKSGDKDFLAVKNPFSISNAHNKPELDDYEIKNIINYLKK